MLTTDFQDSDKTQLDPLLFPCGNLRREALPSTLASHGLQLHCVTAYHTTADPGIATGLRAVVAREEEEGEGGGEHCWMVFFSPSGVEFALDHIKEAFDVSCVKVYVVLQCGNFIKILIEISYYSPWFLV